MIKIICKQMNLFNYGIIDETYKKNNKKCQFTLAKKPFEMFTPGVFVLAKNGPYTKATNEQYYLTYKMMDFID